MVLLGGTGILKCLSFLLQLLIVVTVWRKQKNKGAEFMSETSGLDNTMNWTYTVVLLAGAPSHNHRLLFVLPFKKYYVTYPSSGLFFIICRLFLNHFCVKFTHIQNYIVRNYFFPMRGQPFLIVTEKSLKRYGITNRFYI